MVRTRKMAPVVCCCALLGAMTLIAFWPVFQNDFVRYDDPDYVTENLHVLKGLSWANVGWAFAGGHAGNWHPLTWLSHMLDVQLFGLNAAGHHAINLLIHVGNTLVLFLLLKRMTGAFWRSGLVAAFFGVHPLHVESVAWIAERKDVLSLFFGLLCLWAYVIYVEKSTGRNPSSGSTNAGLSLSQGSAAPPGDARRRWLFYAAALVLFALALMSKPMLVTLPYLLLLLDWWPLRRLEFPVARLQPATWALVWEKIPFFGLAALSSIATLRVQQAAGAVGSLEGLPLDFRISNALISYVRYLAKTLWPDRLGVFYPLPNEWPLWATVGAALFVAGVSFLVLWRAGRAPHATVGWLWYLGTLVPVIGIVQVGQQAMADRYSYLPQIGLLLAIVWTLAEVQASWPGTAAWLRALGVIAVGACAALTWVQARYWRNNLALFEHTIAVTRDNAVAQNNLGVSLLEVGKLAAAESHFAEAVRLKPSYADALVNLGLCRVKQGRSLEATELMRRAAAGQVTPAVHYDLAKLLAQQGQFEEAQSHYQSALQLKPEFIEAWYNLGELNAKHGKPEEAARDFTSALRLKPDYLEARLSLGALLAGRRQFDAAIAQFNAALQTAPRAADAHFNLGAALEAKGELSDAADHYAEACRLRPTDSEARERLGLALLYQGKIAEGVAQLQEVVQTRPDANAHYHLALALDMQGLPEAALTHYHEAVRLNPKAALCLNDLAWLLATHPKAQIRNGTEAVRLAEQACQLSGGKEPRFWGTLDAAYAEAGRFEDAVRTAVKTKELALAAGQAMVAQKADERLALYRAHKAYRPSPASEAKP